MDAHTEVQYQFAHSKIGDFKFDLSPPLTLREEHYCTAVEGRDEGL